MENGHLSLSPCPNHLVLKEKLTVGTGTKLLSSHFSPVQNAGDRSLGSKIFERTEDDNKVAPSIEYRHLIQLMDREMFIDDANSRGAPLPFRIPRPRLPNNRKLALTRFPSLRRTLERKPDMKSHFLVSCRKSLIKIMLNWLHHCTMEKNACTFRVSACTTHASLTKSESCLTPVLHISASH